TQWAGAKCESVKKPKPQKGCASIPGTELHAQSRRRAACSEELEGMSIEWHDNCADVVYYQLADSRAQIVVEKLTKNVNEAHLREIFGAYGPIREVELPMNRQFMTNRGTAYIMYNSPNASEAAIAHMHEAQLDGAVIHVSIVLPRRKFSRSPPPARRGLPPFESRRDAPQNPYRAPPPPSYGARAPPPQYRSPPPRRGYVPPTVEDAEQKPQEQDEICEGEVEELHKEQEQVAAKEEGRWG
ncbi:hypothetical protein MMC11_008420, partial [Xylographa trunciseda]|nr:hypothetical protein [Xylographa trunciseda]